MASQNVNWMNDTVEITFKGAQRKGAVSREFDVPVWALWNAADAAMRTQIVAGWFNRFVSVATKDANSDVGEDASEADRIAAETARLDVIAGFVETLAAGDAERIKAVFFAPGKRAAGGGGSVEFTDAEALVIKRMKETLKAKLDRAGKVVASGKRGAVESDYCAALLAQDGGAKLARAKGETFVWRDAGVLAYALDKDAGAVAAAEAELSGSDDFEL